VLQVSSYRTDANGTPSPVRDKRPTLRRPPFPNNRAAIQPMRHHGPRVACGRTSKLAVARLHLPVAPRACRERSPPLTTPRRSFRPLLEGLTAGIHVGRWEEASRMPRQRHAVRRGGAFRPSELVLARRRELDEGVEALAKPRAQLRLHRARGHATQARHLRSHLIRRLAAPLVSKLELLL